ncbi:hypothetical protein QVD17_36051 [Tagetes erecta]|uniref:Protein kinase domain-containing protein n=1 Tax=Tagetes erecta TaxID=13708 RepID=A0AAD8JXT6_TARER|nr:hypothetical protein QVD17_36051 [Tagetes erecta]
MNNRFLRVSYNQLLKATNGFSETNLIGKDTNQSSSTGVKGTIGYAPPEYGLGSDMTSSGDVYSFGILLLEVMTGKKPTDNIFNDNLSLHKFASMALSENILDVIDVDAIAMHTTESNTNQMEECLASVVKIGVSCSMESPTLRMNINDVVHALLQISDTLQNTS